MDNKGFLIFDVLILLIVLMIIVSLIFPVFNSLIMNISNNKIEENCYDLASEFQIKLEDIVLNDVKQEYYNLDLDAIVYNMKNSDYTTNEIINYKGEEYELIFNSSEYNDHLFFVNFEINYNGEVYEEFTYFMER